MMACVRHGILAVALVLPFGASARDCVQAAARYHGVSETVLRAIAWHESKHNAWAVGKNSNGTLDIGRMQVNTIHLSELAKYGIAPATIEATPFTIVEQSIAPCLYASTATSWSPGPTTPPPRRAA